MNGNSRYSNILTMFLVVFIVAILGIIVYFAYDLLNSNRINDNAKLAMNELERATTSVKRDTSSIAKKDEDGNTNSIDMDEALAQLDQATGNLSQQQVEAKPEAEKVYMEGYEVLGTIKIPKTKCEYPILDNITKRSLEIAVGLAPYGPGLNKVGNSIIFGHNYRNGLFFSNNKNLTNGDLVYITDKEGQTVTYEIYNIYQTDANDAEYFTRDTEGRREISLQTCTDDGANRIIIWAKEK